MAMMSSRERSLIATALPTLVLMGPTLKSCSTIRALSLVSMLLYQPEALYLFVFRSSKLTVVVADVFFMILMVPSCYWAMIRQGSLLNVR